jgi:hypothetical protein
MSNKIKGNILEDLVAMMHEMPGVRVEKRRKLPVLRSKTKRKREIDILITSSVAGYKVQIALGCKNEAQALKTSAVDNFVGILNDVGIPIQQGILVSANGYTRDAQDAADAHGLRTLVFEGLSADRLGQEINAALKAVVYLLVSQFTLSMLPYVEDGWADDGRFITAILDRDDEPPVTQILTSVWELWVSGKIPDTIGEHLICLAPKKERSTALSQLIHCFINCLFTMRTITFDILRKCKGLAQWRSPTGLESASRLLLRTNLQMIHPKMS